MAELIKDEKGSIVKQRYKISEILPHANQFADELTRNPPRYSFDELVEEFKPTVARNVSQGRELYIFNDRTCLEFFARSPRFIAHPAIDLERVLTTDSRTLPEFKGH